MNVSARSVLLAARLLPVAFLAAGIGCEYLGGRTVVVEFLSAEGIEKGDAVYFAGVRVGQTGDATVMAGRARVPVYLTRRHRDALPTGAVFVVGDDPNLPSRRALVGYAVASVQARTEDGMLVYQGLSCQIEMAVLLGAETAKELMGAMKR